MLAVLNGHTECVYSLLSQGASVENRDRWGRTALHRGVRCPPAPPEVHHLHLIFINHSFLLLSDLHTGSDGPGGVCGGPAPEGG